MADQLNSSAANLTTTTLTTLYTASATTVVTSLLAANTAATNSSTSVVWGRGTSTFTFVQNLPLGVGQLPTSILIRPFILMTGDTLQANAASGSLCLSFDYDALY